MIVAYDFAALRRDYPLAKVAADAGVKLRRSSHNMIGCCPFHPDRSPSFVVWPDHTFHCFGCQAHGDVIDFVGRSRNLRAADAIAFLTGGQAPTLTDEDRRQLDQERAQAEQRRVAHEAAARAEAAKRWAEALPINGTPNAYLTRKDIAPYGARTEGDWLLLPIHAADGTIASVQAISAVAGGPKLFHAGAPVAGGRMFLGEETRTVIIAEGFATGASVHMALNGQHQVCVAFSKSNIERVARELALTRRVIIAADTDAELAMRALAGQIGATVVVPDMQGAEGKDFNDQQHHYGLDDVERTLRLVLDARMETPLPLVWYEDVQAILTNNWIIKHVVPAEAFATIIGHPGCGKSFLALDMALHIATGQEWQGRKVKQGLVVYLAAEGQRGQMNRVEAWRRKHGGDKLPFALIPVAVNMRDAKADIPKLIQTIEAACERAGLPLAALIIDTLNRTFGGGDENGEDMGEYIDNSQKVRAHFGCTTIVVHHVPKNAENPSERGHSSLRGAIDTSLLVSSDPETGVRTLRCLKQKDGEDGWQSQFKLGVVELGMDEDGDPVTSCVVEPAESDMAAARSFTGPRLSGVQRQVYQELLATLEACGVPVPRDVPDDYLDRYRVGKVASVKTWRERWIAVAGSDLNPDSASATFRRARTDLQNKGLIGVWNDHAWATFQ